jgi:hypothetical protein
VLGEEAMTVNIDFTGWAKRDEAIWLDGYDDVRVWFSEGDTEPFCGQVGGIIETYRRLEEAMIYARTLAEERAILTAPDPLPGYQPEPEEVETQDRRFLDARGLVSR